MQTTILAPHPFGTEQNFDDIVQRFKRCSLWEDSYRELIKISRLLPILPDELRTKALEITGCENRVWLGVQYLPNGKLHFYGDSEGRIVKGLLAILLSICEGQTPTTLSALDIMQLFSQTGLTENLSATRSQGLTALIKALKNYASASLG